MNKELEQKLQEKYPEIFRDLYGDYRKTCMSEGITCGDGWYNILDALCYALQCRVKYYGAEQVVAAQIKEKFGGLRFYYNGGDDACRHYVEFAEAMSYKTCEVCGNIGEVREGGWIKTLCDEHHQERANRLKNES